MAQQYETCRKCFKLKPPEEFYESSTRQFILWCKACVKEHRERKEREHKQNMWWRLYGRYNL